MARVEVPLGRAQRGELPRVCVVSGRPADGYCPLSVSRGWGRHTDVRLPMTSATFERWHRRSMMRLRAGLGMGFCAFGAAITIRFPTVAMVFVVLTLALGGAWFFATFTLPAVTPSMHIDGSRLVLADAHREFADRVLD